MNLTQLKTKDISSTREQILQKQDNVCAICKNTITSDSGASLDHQHMTSKETIGEDGAGLIRGVLCRSCNSTEGRIWNAMRRHLQPSDVQDRIQWLESLIEYYKKETYTMIHPTEAPKVQLMSKRQYNKLKKMYTLSEKRAKFPDFPKSKKCTKKLQVLFNEFNISPFT